MLYQNNISCSWQGLEELKYIYIQDKFCQTHVTPELLKINHKNGWWSALDLGSKAFYTKLLKNLAFLNILPILNYAIHDFFGPRDSYGMDDTSAIFVGGLSSLMHLLLS